MSSAAGPPGGIGGRRAHDWLTLGDLLRERARSSGGTVAAICGDHRATYAETDRRVDRLAAVLAARGVVAGDRVLWLGQNCHRLLESLLACGRVGAALVPANWRLSAEELADQVDDLRPSLVLWQHAALGDLVHRVRAAAPDGQVPWLCHDGAGEDGYEAALAAAPDRGAPDLGGHAVATSPVLGLYTGAFSGRPACALIDHVAIAVQSVVVASIHDIDASTVFLCSGPLFHLGTAMSTLATFVQGGTNVFVPDADPERICRQIVAHGVTRAFVVEPTRQRIVDLVAEQGHDISSLHGWPGSPQWNAITTPDTSTWGRATSGYGQTEVMGHVSFRGLAPDGIGEHGRTTSVVEVEILDERGRTLPPGQVGEIAVRGPQVMVGYHDRPEEDARRTDVPRWQRTRDLGRRERDGTLTFVGPKARMLKSGVENVYPAEVEGCIRTHPDVVDCAVIGRPDPVWVQNVHAVVVARPGAVLEATDVVEHCRSRLASYKKPKGVVFVDEIPRPGGVVDYDRLDREHGGGGYPGGDTRALGTH